MRSSAPLAPPNGAAGEEEIQRGPEPVDIRLRRVSGRVDPFRRQVRRGLHVGRRVGRRRPNGHQTQLGEPGGRRRRRPLLRRPVRAGAARIDERADPDVGRPDVAVEAAALVGQPQPRGRLTHEIDRQHSRHRADLAHQAFEVGRLAGRVENDIRLVAEDAGVEQRDEVRARQGTGRPSALDVGRDIVARGQPVRPQPAEHHRRPQGRVKGAVGRPAGAGAEFVLYRIPREGLILGGDGVGGHESSRGLLGRRDE